jgi:ribosomal protein S18 acetylase RimI-like enzyme
MTPNESPLIRVGRLARFGRRLAADCLLSRRSHRARYRSVGRTLPDPGHNRARYRRATAFLLVQAERCVGAITLDGKADPAYATMPWRHPEPALVVHRLCIDPGSQGKGLGSHMMAFAETHATREGFASIRLDAYSGNPQAVALYRRRGYRQAGELYFPLRRLPFYLFERAAV